ncbi:MAG: type II TA system antitoxin MqsA family protein [Bacillota bacterium]
MKDTIYCDVCDEYVEYDIKEKKEKRNILNQGDIEIEARVAVCKDCEAELFLEELDKKNQKKAFDIYRKQNGILLQEKIKEIRDMYNLTQKQMSRFLGWGEVTYHRYENGSLPDKTHNNQLKLMQYPRNAKILLEDEPDKIDLDNDVINDLKNRIEDLIDNKNMLKVNLPINLYNNIKLKANKNGMNISEYAIYLITNEYNEEKRKEENEHFKKEIIGTMIRNKIVYEEWKSEDLPENNMDSNVLGIEDYRNKKAATH